MHAVKKKYDFGNDISHNRPPKCVTEIPYNDKFPVISAPVSNRKPLFPYSSPDADKLEHIEHSRKIDRCVRSDIHDIPKNGSSDVMPIFSRNQLIRSEQPHNFKTDIENSAIYIQPQTLQQNQRNSIIIQPAKANLNNDCDINMYNHHEQHQKQRSNTMGTKDYIHNSSIKMAHNLYLPIEITPKRVITGYSRVVHTEWATVEKVETSGYTGLPWPEKDAFLPRATSLGVNNSGREREDDKTHPLTYIETNSSANIILDAAIKNTDPPLNFVISDAEKNDQSNHNNYLEKNISPPDDCQVPQGEMMTTSNLTTTALKKNRKRSLFEEFEATQDQKKKSIGVMNIPFSLANDTVKRSVSDLIDDHADTNILPAPILNMLLYLEKEICMGANRSKHNGIVNEVCYK